MITFDDNDFKNLLEVDGILLSNVEGQPVAIGEGFDYQSVWDFIAAYSKEYGDDQLADRLGLVDGATMYQSFCEGHYDEDNMEALVMKKFAGDYADDLEDEYPEAFKDEAEKEAGDEHYAEAAGK